MEIGNDGISAGHFGYFWWMDAAGQPLPLNVTVGKLMESDDLDRVGEIEARSSAGKEASASHKGSDSGPCRVGMRFVLGAKRSYFGDTFGVSAVFGVSLVCDFFLFGVFFF